MLSLSINKLVNESEDPTTPKPKGATTNPLSKTRKNGSDKKKSIIRCVMCLDDMPVVFDLLKRWGLPIDICGLIAESWVDQNLGTDFVVLHTSRRMKHVSCQAHFKNAVRWVLNVNPTNEATISCPHAGCPVRIEPLSERYFTVVHRAQHVAR